MPCFSALKVLEIQVAIDLIGRSFSERSSMPELAWRFDDKVLPVLLLFHNAFTPLLNTAHPQMIKPGTQILDTDIGLYLSFNRKIEKEPSGRIKDAH
jgi:hypothetical protein